MQASNDNGGFREEGCGAASGDSESGLLAPLLQQAQPAEERQAATVTASGEAYRIVSLGWPIALEEFVTYGSQIIAIGMVGHLGAVPLSVYTLAKSLLNTTGVAYLVGVTGGIDTFCTQTTGAGEFRLAGITLQRGMLATLLLSLPPVLLYSQARRLLTALGQEPQLAAAAGRYILLVSPYVPIHGIVLCINRYLISQGAVGYVLLAGAIFFASAAPTHGALIFMLGLGLDGSALATVACDVVYLLALIGLAAHHSLSKPRAMRPWQGWSVEALYHWGPYLRVALASIWLVALDWWIYDVASLLGGMLPNPDVALAAMGICYSINALAFMIPFGLAFAVCARVGSCLGAGQHSVAKLSAEVGVGLATAVMGVVTVALLLARGQAARPFTSDPQVLAEADTLMPPVALALAANGATAVLTGVLRACRRQAAGALVNLVANWLLGLGLMVLLAFQLKLGAAGLWWGLCIASWVQTSLLVTVMARRIQWSNETQRARRLVRRLSQGRNVPASSLGAGNGA